MAIGDPQKRAEMEKVGKLAVLFSLQLYENDIYCIEGASYHILVYSVSKPLIDN
jgi:hypothetical protein